MIWCTSNLNLKCQHNAVFGIRHGLFSLQLKSKRNWLPVSEVGYQNDDCPVFPDLHQYSEALGKPQKWPFLQLTQCVYGPGPWKIIYLAHVVLGCHKSHSAQGFWRPYRPKYTAGDFLQIGSVSKLPKGKYSTFRKAQYSKSRFYSLIANIHNWHWRMDPCLMLKIT